MAACPDSRRRTDGQTPCHGENVEKDGTLSISNVGSPSQSWWSSILVRHQQLPDRACQKNRSALFPLLSTPVSEGLPLRGTRSRNGAGEPGAQAALSSILLLDPDSFSTALASRLPPGQGRKGCGERVAGHFWDSQPCPGLLQPLPTPAATPSKTPSVLSRPPDTEARLHWMRMRTTSGVAAHRKPTSPTTTVVRGRASSPRPKATEQPCHFNFHEFT
ncbi:hypothetical protein QBC34DRAFT_31354 [Podospora aff. communis PSN243]|uniref:Uncharacterized protein n=1 Tax=Podospora aff. communis PSN243 TaxID=3040156 RepID=A0AAV9GX31_9PEZI|nr:hypothetical protein QBC34DRAFT_31354 [Podospora aff. communis PSN243]